MLAKWPQQSLTLATMECLLYDKDNPIYFRSLFKTFIALNGGPNKKYGPLRTCEFNHVWKQGLCKWNAMKDTVMRPSWVRWPLNPVSVSIKRSIMFHCMSVTIYLYLNHLPFPLLSPLILFHSSYQLFIFLICFLTYYLLLYTEIQAPWEKGPFSFSLLCPQSLRTWEQILGDHSLLNKWIIKWVWEKKSQKTNIKLHDQIGFQMGSTMEDFKSSWKRWKLMWDLRRMKVQCGESILKVRGRSYSTLYSHSTTWVSGT